MSTSGYLRCLTHRPSQRTLDEVGNFSYREQLNKVRQLIKDRDELIELHKIAEEYDLEISHWSDRQMRAIKFLVDHPECKIEIFDEYGKVYSLDEEALNKPTSMWPKLNAPIYVIDDHGVIWLLLAEYGYGMATTAVAIDQISSGIMPLLRERGPLVVCNFSDLANPFGMRLSPDLSLTEFYKKIDEVRAARR